MMHKAGSSIEEVPYCFQGHMSNFKVTGDKKIADFDSNWGFPDCSSSLNITDGFEIMYKAWRSIEDVPYCFSRSSIKFQGGTGLKFDECCGQTKIL